MKYSSLLGTSTASATSSTAKTDYSATGGCTGVYKAYGDSYTAGHAAIVKAVTDAASGTTTAAKNTAKDNLAWEDENNCYKQLAIDLAKFKAGKATTSSGGTTIADWSGTIRSGKAFIAFGTTYDYEPLEKYYGPSRHMTFVFNVFVFL